MSQFDVKMTALADEIKTKNTSVNGKLSIDEMITAVQGIKVGADLPDGITVTPSDVKDGVFYINADGAKQEGDMTVHGKVTVTPNREQQTLENGYYDSIVVEAKTYSDKDAEVDGLTAASNTVRAGFKFIGHAGTVQEGNIYDHGEVHVTLTESEQTLAAGYYDRIVIPAKPSSGGGDDTGIAIYECVSVLGNTWSGYKAVWDGDRLQTIEAFNVEHEYAHVTGRYTIDNPNHTGADRVFVKEADTAELPVLYVNPGSKVSAFAIEGFFVPVDADATGFDREWVGGSENMPVHIYADNTHEYWYADVGVVDSSLEAVWAVFQIEADKLFGSQVGWMFVRGNAGVTNDPSYVPEFVLTTSYIGDAKTLSKPYPPRIYYTGNYWRWFSQILYNNAGLTVSSNITLPADATVEQICDAFNNAGYNFVDQTHDVSHPGWKLESDVTNGLSVKGLVPKIGEAYLADTTAQAILYPQVAVSLYECASYDNGETIPAYTNIVISGLTSPSAANGTYILQDVESTVTDRSWQISTGYRVAATDGYWYIYDEGKKPSYASALYRSPVALATTGEGTADNPVYWDDALNGSAGRYITEVYNTGDYTSSGNKRNFYVKLKAGTAYQMGVTANGNDNFVRLYDLTGKSLVEDDGNSIEINGAACSDAFTYTPTADGIYRFEAGAWSTAVGDVQAVCYPAPEVANAPTKTEPWELEWEKCGYPSGAYIVYGAGYADANGEYEPSNDALDNTTVWTNKSTGVTIKANVSGSWRWEFYANDSSNSSIYYSSWNSTDSPWSSDTEWIGYGISSTHLPFPSLSRGQGQAEGTIALSTETVPERPATGVKTWTGYKATQDAESGLWTIAGTSTTGLTVKGVEPIVGRIYSADTTIQVARLSEAGGKMVCLAHFDGFDASPAFTDATQTCIIQVMPQSNINKEIVKFGSGSWWGNYRALPTNGCFAIKELPVIAGDFTIEFWQYYTGYDKFGGTFLYTYTGGSGDPQNVAEIIGVELAETDVNYRKNQWFHRAFVRQGTTVTEYINGVKVGTSEFNVALGGDRYMVACGGGTATGDVRNYIDEFAIFNYAKYKRNFVPIELPYDDVPSGLRTPDTTVRDVSVSGIKSITFANGKSYALVDSTATGSSRRWATIDNKWFIFFDMMYYMGWVIGNEDALNDAYSDNAMVVAYLQDDMGTLNPIGNAGWQDQYTKTKVKVTAN